MNKKTLVLLAMMAVGMMGGCDWSNPLYEEYVTEDGRVNFCNPIITKETNGYLVELNKLECLNDEIRLKKDDINIKKYGDGFDTIIKACVDDNKKCKNEEKCKFCNDYISDYNVCIEFRNKKLFDYEGILPWESKISFINSVGKNVINDYPDAVSKGICPKDYPRCSFDKDNVIFGCIKDNVVECENDNNPDMKTCSSGCVDLSRDLNNCGSCNNVCTIDERRGEKTADCQDGMCVISECQQGYHLSNDVCELDNKESCNGKPCIYMGGWKDGICNSDLQCEASNCNDGYHILNKKDENFNYVACEEDTVKHCGEERIPCEQQKGVSLVMCNVGKCINVRCDDNYHWDALNENCIENSKVECGTYNNNCEKLTGWSGGECKNGKCKVELCKSGFHLNDDGTECILDTNKECGNSKDDCDSNGKVCINGVCELISACDKETMQLCDGECVNINNIKYCGDCLTNCMVNKSNSIGVDCIDKKCIATSCEPNYHLENGSCIQDDNNNCGSKGNKCEATGNVNSVECYEGRCMATSCKNNFHLSNGMCVPDASTCCGSQCLDCKNFKCERGNCSKNCVDGFGDCNGNAEDGCEMDLYSNGLKYESKKCSCRYDYTKCGELQKGVPLCLKVSSNIGKSYCSEYCNSESTGEYVYKWSYSYYDYYYMVNKCKPAQKCKAYEVDTIGTGEYDKYGYQIYRVNYRVDCE